MTGGQGNDSADLGDGNDTFIWNPGDGSDIVEGGAGTDTLVFDGANVGERIDISANGGRALLTRDIGIVTMDLNSVEHIQLNTLGGADTVTVNDLTGTGVDAGGDRPWCHLAVAVTRSGHRGRQRHRR